MSFAAAAGRVLASWRAQSSAKRDIVSIFSTSALAWLVIERTDACTTFFDWVAENPDYEVDSLILAFILSAFSITVFAWRRYREMVIANRARDLAEKNIHSLAYHDTLTGLPNRRALNEALVTLKDQGTEQTSALIFFDLDRFKGVNDLYGHFTGDRLLRLVASRVLNRLDDGQTVHRLGGDEFAVIVHMQDASDVTPQNIARSIVQMMAEPFEDGTLVHHIGASVGLAIFPSDAINPDDLIRAADIALYKAKDAGRGQYRSYELAMDEQMKRRAVLEQEMRAAIVALEFTPHYQPLVDLSTGETVGYELLARWLRKDGRYVGPDQFISIAEESGLINDLMLSLLDKAYNDARDWNPALTIAVNISPTQLKDPWLSQKILGALVKHGFAPQRLAIEVTETAIIADEENARRLIESFKNLGMRVGLDDFGTGYASLHHLRTLPFDKIKIDKSFITDLGRDKEALKIVKAILGLAMSLELPVIAEGIESAEVAEILKALGCEQGQGFHFGRPVSGEIITQEMHKPQPKENQSALSKVEPPIAKTA